MKSLSVPGCGFTVYAFGDLPSVTQDEILCNFVNDMLETGDTLDNHPDVVAAIEKAHQMQTPWFAGEYIFNDCRDLIIELIEINEYLFTAQGRMIPLCYHYKNNQFSHATLTVAGEEWPIEISAA